MKRGELGTVAGGVHARTPRPALIVQDDVFDATASVTVAPLTTRHVDAPLLRPAIPADARSGLRQDSAIMIDKLTTVRRSNAVELVGSLSAEQVLDVERALMVFLGLAR